MHVVPVCQRFPFQHVLHAWTGVRTRSTPSAVHHCRPKLGDADGCAANFHRSLHDLDPAGSVHKCW